MTWIRTGGLGEGCTACMRGESVASEEDDSSEAILGSEDLNQILADEAQARKQEREAKVVENFKQQQLAKVDE